MFDLPKKQIIVNSASQLRILTYNSSGTYIDIASPLLASSGFFLEGFLQPILFGQLKVVTSGSNRMIATAGAAGTKQVATWTMNAVTGGDSSGEQFILQYNSLKLSPTEYQNQPILKHYSVSATMGANATNANTALAIQNAINSDANCPVTVSRSTNVLTFTAKEAGVTFALYNTAAVRGGLISGTFAVTVLPTNDVGTYEDLKNINWAKNVDFNRNAEFFPVFGQTYKKYRFILQSTGFTQSMLVPGQAPQPSFSDVEIWIANGLTLQTTMDLVVADANTAV